MAEDLAYLLIGLALVLAVILPSVLHRRAFSAPIVLLAVGVGFGFLPLPGDATASLSENKLVVKHLTELTVLVALMGVGLALDRPLAWRRPKTWASWSVTWRLIAIGMPLSIAGVALIGWWVMGLAPAAAVLLGAVLAPTDPVLATDVQVEGPSKSADEAKETDAEEEDDEVRFGLTSEAGLNDGLAFPFVYLAIFLATKGATWDWALRWVAFELVGKIVIGTLVGIAVGWGLAKLAFRSPQKSMRLAEIGEPLLALAAVLVAYGAAELAQGYGFLAVFACAMTLRSAERDHDYHVHMHGTIETMERLLTLAVLVLLGMALSSGLWESLTWQGALVGTALLLVIRPATAWLALALRLRHRPRSWTEHGELAAVAFFGVRGVGSLYYLAYATSEAKFAGTETLWATVAFTIALSVVLHGITAGPIMHRLDRARGMTEEPA